MPVKVELGTKQRMRDGVKLSADIFRPDVKGKFPVILTRTPYRTVEGFQDAQNEEARFFAQHGYAYVIQDCRGKNDSEGVYRPFLDDDRVDGYDTVVWATKQPWSNGKVGTVGASYAAWNQWQTATLRPPGLKTMVCTVALPDPVLNVPYQNGALVLWMSEWMALIEGRRNTKTTSVNDPRKNFWHLPVRSIDEQFGRKDSRIWQEWVAHPSADRYWRAAFYQDKLDRVRLPVLHITGWYDDDIIGTHINYLAMTDSSRDEKTRKSQKLIIGPWQHTVNVKRKLGEVDFGESALVDLRGTKLRWFDRWLKGADNGIDKEPLVDIFTTGRNSWSKGPLWPYPNARPTRFYLHSKGRANTCSGDGTLSTAKPASEPDDAYAYDPGDPAPNIDDDGNLAEGPFDQRPVERRNDVLVYSTPPLADEVEVSGRITVSLFASTSRRDTDFWAQLTDVYPNGFSMHLTEGIIRGRYRKSLENAQLLRPGEVNEFPIDLWIISNAFQRGHRIRLDISSSSFPKYDRNPNTGNAFGQDSELLIAEQRIFHDLKHPSSVTLPIVG
ncbi:MAG: CocE/NonD family hydrolase [Nitrososphaerota archaeon]|nr:CocE/NonD family hydrolase [Nitrososphaerota archaeon]